MQDYSFSMSSAILLARRMANKLLPILLVVVLSGCGGSQIESCADDKYKAFSTEPHLSYSACLKHLPGGKLTTQMIFDEGFGRIKFSEKFYECARVEQRKERDSFIGQSLRKKISNQLYETYYLRCKTIYQ